MRWRVVWAFEVIMLSRSPTRSFIRVDLPTFGLPTIFTKPDCGLLSFFIDFSYTTELLKQLCCITQFEFMMFDYMYFSPYAIFTSFT